jgi:hypothetical protein
VTLYSLVPVFQTIQYHISKYHHFNTYCRKGNFLTNRANNSDWTEADAAPLGLFVAWLVSYLNTMNNDYLSKRSLYGGQQILSFYGHEKLYAVCLSSRVELISVQWTADGISQCHCPLVAI